MCINRTNASRMILERVTSRPVTLRHLTSRRVTSPHVTSLLSLLRPSTLTDFFFDKLNYLERDSLLFFHHRRNFLPSFSSQNLTSGLARVVVIVIGDVIAIVIVSYYFVFAIDEAVIIAIIDVIAIVIASVA